MADHARFVALATRLIEKNGRDVILKEKSGTATDTNKPWKGSTSSPTVLGTVKAVFVPFRGFEFGSTFTDDELMKSVDEVCLIAGGNDAFDNTTLIYDETKDLKVEWIRRLRPADLTVLYAFGVMR
jgi:hypothetical protein